MMGYAEQHGVTMGTSVARGKTRAAAANGLDVWRGWEVTPARTSSRRPSARLAVVPRSGAVAHRRLSALPELLEAGDVVVINDAGTLPASLSGRVVGSGAAVELRLAASLDADHASLERWVAAVLGEGSWREPTEHRPAPARLEVGDVVRIGQRLRARVEAVRDAAGRLVEVRLEADDGDLWGALYAEGRPVQYAYHEAPLAVWDQQTPFAGAPVALEPPSSGFHLTWALVGRLREAGVEVVPITHGTGLSTLGDDALDALLPLPELTHISAASAARIARAKRAGRRVVAVGTGVVRALESAAQSSAQVASGSMTTLLRLGPEVDVHVVDGLLTGLHAPDTSHGRLLASLVGMAQVERSWEAVARAGYLGHEYGDMALVWRV